MTVKFIALGLDHRHIYGMTAQMLATGATCLGYWTQGKPNTLPGFTTRFPDIPRIDTLEQALDTGADLALIAAVPAQRAALAIKSIRCGMDIMVDKPGCTTRSQLDEIKVEVQKTGRIWSVNFSERFEVPSATLASRLVASGAIGRVVHTAGFGPHRLNAASRPEWFFDRKQYGGILVDIASHQIDQFLHYTGSDNADVVNAYVANHAHPSHPGLQDFGEIGLRNEHASGTIRVDWFTPDALPTWGDGRLTLLGTEGYIELRKYIDVGGPPGTDHLILANSQTCERIDASTEQLTYFDNFTQDIRNRTEKAMTQSHCFKVMELALRAQEMAERQGE